MHLKQAYFLYLVQLNMHLVFVECLKHPANLSAIDKTMMMCHIQWSLKKIYTMQLF